MSCVDGFIDEIGHAGVHIKLASFLLHGHALKQVVDARLNGSIGALVKRIRGNGDTSLCGFGCGRCGFRRGLLATKKNGT